MESLMNYSNAINSSRNDTAVISSMNQSQSSNNVTLTFGPAATAAYIAVYFLIFTMIIVGNTLVIVTFVSMKDLRKVRNYPLISLAVTDLITGLIAQPLVMYINIVTSEHTCQSATRNLFYFPTALLVGSSLWHLILIAVDRCLSLTFHLKYPSMVTHRKMLFWIAVLWLVNSLLTVIAYTTQEESEDECRDENAEKHKSHVGFFSLSIAIIIPCFCLSMIALYSYMLRVAFNQIKERRKFTNKVNAVKEARAHVRCLVTMATVVGALGICLLPTTAVTLVEFFVDIDEDLFIALEAVTDSIIFANSAVNPLIYAYFNPTFRAGIKLVFVKWGCKEGTATR